MRPRVAAVAFPVVLLATMLLGVTPAGAQTTDEDRAVQITFDVGDFDGDRGDWPITVVYVTGELEEGQPFTVEMTADDGSVLWSGTDVFRGPTTAIAVDAFVAVGDVTGAGLSQTLPEVAAEEVERPVPVEVLAQGAGGGGSGQLALSMALAVIFVALLFRTPLPSASTQRWTK